jgi:hypothetical protein
MSYATIIIEGGLIPDGYWSGSQQASVRASVDLVVAAGSLRRQGKSNWRNRYTMISTKFEY